MTTAIFNSKEQPSTKAPSTNLFDSIDFDWDSYLIHRPTYSQIFYSIILDHHRTNGGQHDLAYDIGTGPGLVAEELSKYFSSVVASDASVNYSNVAKQRLSTLKNAHQFAVRQSRAEELGDWVEPGSVDMITIAEAIHWTEPAAVLASATKVLRRGGTLAIWYHGAPIFPDGEERCQALLQEIIERSFDRMRPFKGATFECGAAMLRSYLDNIEFKTEEWESVKRLKWNCDRPLEVLDHEKLDFEVKYESKIGGSEEVVEKTDRGFWGLEADVTWLKGYVEHIGPGKEMNEERKDQIERLWGGLAGAMGGSKQIGWPVVLLLATRK